MVPKVQQRTIHGNPVDTGTANPKPKSSTWLPRQAKQRSQSATHRWVPKKILEAQKGSRYIWLPKQKCTKENTALPRHTSKESKGSAKTNNITEKTTKQERQTINLASTSGYNLRWISKATLKEQGYYDGATQLWLPKQWQLAVRQVNTQKVGKPYIGNHKKEAVTAKQSQTSVWRPKQKAADTVEHKTPPTLTRAQKGKWIPKSSMMPTLPEPTAEVCSNSSIVLQDFQRQDTAFNTRTGLPSTIPIVWNVFGLQFLLFSH